MSYDSVMSSLLVSELVEYASVLLISEAEGDVSTAAIVSELMH